MQRSRGEGLRRFSSVDGLTMVEVLVALIILGFILSATAASLIAFSRTAAANQARVQATALLTERHEFAQVVPWTRFALYIDEVDAVVDDPARSLPVGDDIGVLDNAASPPTYDGAPLVLLPGPVNIDCPGDSACGRSTVVPDVYDSITDRDVGRDYELWQFITERQVGADPTAVTRRLTTILRWEVLGRPFTQVFESERAPLPGERRQVVDPQVRLFLLTPRRVEVQDDGSGGWTTIDEVRVFVRATPRYSTPQLLLPGNPTPINLAPGVLPDSWVADFPAGSTAFAPVTGGAVIRAADLVEGGVVEVADLQIDVVAASDPPIPVIDDWVGRSQPSVTAPVVAGDLGAPPTVFVRNDDDGEVRLCTEVTFALGSYDFDPDDVVSEVDDVRISAFHSGRRLQGLPLDPSTDGRSVVLEAGTTSPWSIEPGDSLDDRLFVIAEVGEFDRGSVYQMSSTFTVRMMLSGACPT